MGSSKRKRRRDSDTGGATAESAELKTVYVDTSLGTHLAVLVHSSDTASEFKKKVAMEHKQCFPEMGGIHVHSAKIKRNTNYYHLADAILVWSVFHGVKKNWFLSADVSNIPITLTIRDSSELGTNSGTNKDGDGRGLIFDANMNETLPLALPGSAAEENADSEMIVEPKVIKPVEKTTDSPKSIYSEEHYMGIKSPVKKKRKVGRNKDKGHSFISEGVDPVYCPDGNYGKPNVPNLDIEGRLVSDETSLPSMAGKSNLGSILDSRNVNSSATREEDNRIESMVDSGVGEDVGDLGVVSVFVPGSSARKMEVDSGGRDVSTAGSMRKKKKVRKTAAKFQDTTETEQIGKEESIKPSTDYMAEGKGLSLEDDHEGIMPSKDKAPEHVGPDLALKEASLSLDADKSSVTVVNSHKLLASDGKKEGNAIESKVDSEFDQDVPAMHVEGVCIDIPDCSAALMDGGGGSRDINTDVKRKKKKKKVKKIAEVLDIRDVEQIGIGEMKYPHETIRAGENGLSLGHDKEVTPPSDCKAPDHVYPDLAMKEASIIRDADDVMEPQISLDWPSSSGNHIPEETGKKGSIGLNDGKDVEMILSDASNHDAEEKTERTLEDASVINKMMTERTICSAGDCHAETENTIVESNQTDTDNKNTENRHAKSKKKTKRRRTTTDVQENVPADDQKVGSEPLATNQTSVFANSELEVRYVDSSEVLSCKSEEKVDEKHELVANTDGHAENSGKTDEGINFKSYFVADQLQNKVDSRDKVRKATRSTRSSTKAKSNDLPSVHIPTELENSVKSLENKKPENSSNREDTVRTMCDSVHNSDGDEMSPNSLKRSSKTTEKEVKGSSPDLCAVTSEKPDDIVTGSSFQKKIPSLDNSSSERSQTLDNNVGNEMPRLGQHATSMTPMKTPKKKISSAKSGAILHNNRAKGRPMLGQNATNLSLMKTPKKKISLAKSGAIFEDNSGESSGDENGTVHSDAGTVSPSDSSSMLGDSAGESELSQNSFNNGCSDAKEKSSSKFDLSAKGDLTMDVILRSSKRFKKAKQLASQNETEPIEFVPESQPL